MCVAQQLTFYWLSISLYPQSFEPKAIRNLQTKSTKSFLNIIIFEFNKLTKNKLTNFIEKKLPVGCKSVTCLDVNNLWAAQNRNEKSQIWLSKDRKQLKREIKKLISYLIASNHKSDDLQLSNDSYKIKIRKFISINND